MCFLVTCMSFYLLPLIFFLFYCIFSLSFELRLSLSNFIRSLIGSVLDLYINLRINGMFTDLNLSIQEHWVSLQLFFLFSSPEFSIKLYEDFVHFGFIPGYCIFYIEIYGLYCNIWITDNGGWDERLICSC